MGPSQYLYRPDPALIATATGTFLYRQFFLTIPDELVEAAKMDGAGALRFFKDILMPLSTTNMAALGTIMFVWAWNQYLWPLLVTTDSAHGTAVMELKELIPGKLRHSRLERRHGRHARHHAAAARRGDPDAALVRARPDRDRKVGRRGMADITIRGLRKSYGSSEIVHGIDLDIRDGEFVVVLGPSGCGKSTLLRLIAGLEEITGGEIAIGGRVVNRLEPRERGCAMVFQNYALYPHMTVAENIGYALKVAGVSKRERTERIARVAKILELDALPRPQARRALGRATPARRHGPRHDPRAERLPLRRAALQSRRQAPRADADRDPAPASAAERDQHLRHPRPDRGDDARRPPGRDERGPDRADRRARRGLSPAVQPLSWPASSARRQ